MTHLAQAIADTHACYVGKNDDLEGFFSDLAIMITNCEDDLEALAEELEQNLRLVVAMDGEDEEGDE